MQGVPATVVVIVALLLAAGGCSGGKGTPLPDGAGPDAAGTDAMADAGPDAGWALAPAAPPVLTPCPDGWREVVDPSGGPTTCDPFPEGGSTTCAADEAHFAGERSCRRIGAPCPAGDWAEDLPADAVVVYVRAGAPAGGDGTRALPYATIRSAVGAAPSGSIVALAKGTYDEVVVLRRAVTLWGACVAMTFVTSSQPDEDFGIVQVSGSAVELRNLTIGGARPGIVETEPRAAMRLEGVLLARAKKMALLIEAGSVTGADVVVRDTEPAQDGRFGGGVFVGDGATARLERVVLERNHYAGIQAQGAGAVVTVSGLSVREVGSDGEAFGFGVLAGSEAELEVQGALIESTRSAGVMARHGSTVRLGDVVVRGTERDASPNFAAGIAVIEGSSAHLDRVLVERNTDYGVVDSGAGSRIDAADLVVRDGESDPSSGELGRGLEVNGGAEATLSRAWFGRNREVGIVVLGPGSLVTIADGAIVDTRERELDGRHGRGAYVQDGAVLVAGRLRIERNRALGLAAIGVGTRLELEDVAIVDTMAEPDGLFGHGLTADADSQVVARRLLIDGNAEAGLLAAYRSTVALVDVVIRGTRRRDCEPGVCAGGGYGLVSAHDAFVEAMGFVVADNALCGVSVALGGTMDLHGGEVSGHPIGASVQTEGFDYRRLEDDVLYVDNERNLSTETLPVPEPGEPL